MKRIILFLILLVSLIGCTSPTDSVGTIEFSLTRDEDSVEIGERTNTFKISDEKFFYYTILSGNTGRYSIIFEKNDSVYLEDKDNINISPDWNSMTAAYNITFFETGKYTMKIFNLKDETLVSIGEFEIIE